jgi:hypothetical protein
MRFYFWLGKGHPRIRIRVSLGTAAFQERYDALRRGQTLIAGFKKASGAHLALALCTLLQFRRISPTCTEHTDGATPDIGLHMR